MTDYIAAPPVACPGTVSSVIPSPSPPLAGIAQYTVQPPVGGAPAPVELGVAGELEACSRCHGTGKEPDTKGLRPLPGESQETAIGRVWGEMVVAASRATPV